MLVYPCGIDLSSSHLRFLTAQLREHRRRIGSRWRRLPAGRQALLALAHLRNGDTYAQLAAGFGIGTSTVFRYIREVIELEVARIGAVGDTGNGTGTGSGDHGVATLCDHWGVCPRFHHG